MADIVGAVARRPVPGRRPDRDPRGRATRRSGIREAATASRRCRSRCPTAGARRRWPAAVFMPYDKSAALLLWGALGLVVILVLETIACMAVLGQDVVDAAYGSAKTLVTVDPNDEVADGPKGLKVVPHGLDARRARARGVVHRRTRQPADQPAADRLFGRRAVPRRDHVVVVGLGQVGLRLCLLLRRCGIGVVAVDDREDGENVGLARELGFPVVIGRGADPSLLRRLSLGARVRARRRHRRRPREHLDRDGGQVAERATCAWSCAPATGGWRTRPARCSGSALVRDVHRIAAALIAARATGSDGGARRLRRRRRAPAARGRPPRGGGRLGYCVSSSAIASNTWTYASTDASSWVTDSVHSSSRPGVMKIPRFMLNSHASSAMSASWLALKVS